ncbi:minor capsid protein [Tsukamurella sp. NPDC003166]|uniref:minor capsid protein n=1 Tax=Tsukamurella sp. NPDC003166 TaxID=3154444 RepID=UPI0033A89DFD
MTASSAEVLRALAQHLADLGVAVYTPTYPASVPLPAVTFGRLPQSPTLAVALNRYHTDTSADSANPTMRIQLRWRASKLLAVERIADDAHRAIRFNESPDLTSEPQMWPGGVRVQSCARVISAPSEPDANGNWERADSFELILNPA